MSKEKELLRIEVPNYIRYVKLSNSRRAKYYTKDGKIPKKYQKKPIFDKKGRLVDPLGNPIISNIRSMNKPRMKKINGQDFYKGEGSYHIRSKVVHEIKDFFRTFVKGSPAIKTLPVQVDIELYDVVDSQLYDLDNLWIYNKCMQDVLVDEGILPEDNFLYITRPGAPEFFPVDTPEERKMIFILREDTRDVIKNSKRYQAMYQAEADW